MTISANIGETEYDFILQPPVEDENLWVGRKENEGTSYIRFIYSNGIISDLVIDNSITTEHDIILERLIEILRGFVESQQMGFENEQMDDLEDVDLKPYDPELIRVRPMVLSAFQVHVYINKGKVDLNPDFQRNFVWSDVQKSRLIESMLLKIPLPAFYFAEDRNGNFQVVDGLQRLTVINQYLNNKFKLRNLEYLHALEGKYFSVDPVKGIGQHQSLYEPYDSRVETTMLNINVIEASSPLRVKYDIFFRINTGGRPLNHQEIRNCFATTKVRGLLKRMADSDIFKVATSYSVKDTRMDAQELALRFIAFLFFRENYLGDMNSFLNMALEKINDLTEDDLRNTENKYYKALEYSHHLFGQYAFRKCLPEHLLPSARKQFLNKAMFIVWTVILADVGYDLLNTPVNEFQKLLSQELEVDRELFNTLTTGTTDRFNLNFVFTRFEQLLDTYMIL